MAGSTLSRADSLDALRSWGRLLQKSSCDPVVAALKDPNPHVMLQAIDQLGGPCPAATADLVAIVASLDTRPRAWHAPAHALVTLARHQPDSARKALPAFAGHRTWQVRMYAARAAGILAGGEA